MYFGIIASFLFIIILIVKSCKRPKNFPPGPLFLPFIGSWYTIPGTKTENQVHGWRKKYGNIIGHKMGHQYMVFISGFEEVVSGLKNSKFQKRIQSKLFQSRTFDQNLGLFFADGEPWVELRRFTLRYLSQIFYSRLEEAMHDEMMNFFSNTQLGEITEVNNKFLQFSLNVSMNLLIATKLENNTEKVDRFRYLTNRHFKVGRPVGIEIIYPFFRYFFNYDVQQESIRYANLFILEHLQQHHATFDPNNIRDYIDAFLLKQQEEKKLLNRVKYYSDEQIISALTDILQASNESTGNTLAFVLLYVSLNPEIQDKIHKELDSVIGRDRFPKLDDRDSLPYCIAVLYEAMRINSISPLSVSHFVEETTKFYGYTLPKNCLLFFALNDIFMDAKEFGEQPELFKPERFLSSEMKSKLISFGLGKRSCVGETLAKNVMFLFITYFFQKYSITLPAGYEKPCTDAVSGFTNSAKPFKLIINERCSNK
ncbi:hypothetical protein PGB90_004997 [Kerria lacca]